MVDYIDDCIVWSTSPQEALKQHEQLLSIVCAQTSCAVLSHCFTDYTCALSLMRGTISRGLLRWKLEMHIKFENSCAFWNTI